MPPHNVVLLCRPNTGLESGYLAGFIWIYSELQHPYRASKISYIHFAGMNSHSNINIYCQFRIKIKCRVAQIRFSSTNTLIVVDI